MTRSWDGEARQINRSQTYNPAQPLKRLYYSTDEFSNLIGQVLNEFSLIAVMTVVPAVRKKIIVKKITGLY